MKVLLLNCVYIQGSTGKIVVDTREYLIRNGIDTFVGYGNFLSEKTEKVFKFGTKWETKLFSILSKLGYAQYASSPVATYRLLHYIDEVCPDIVHLHCMNGYCVNLFSLLEYLAAKKIKTVVTHHAEFYYTGNCGYAYDCNGYSHQKCRKCPTPKQATNTKTFICPSHYSWKRMYNAFRSFDKNNLVFTAVSPWVKLRSSQSPIVNKFDCHVVNNGLETSVFHRRQTSTFTAIKEGYQFSVLHVTAAFIPQDKDNIKGGYYVVEIAKRMPNVKFIIAASYVKVDTQLPENILVYGSVSDQDKLAELYSVCDTTLLTSKRETFSMVTAESLCCGTPVVGFKAGGPETIALDKYSRFVEYGDIASLEKVLSEVLKTKYDHEIMSQEAQSVYSKERMASEFLNIYNDLYNK